MKRSIWVIFVVAVVNFSYAQDLGPEAPILGKGTLGYNGLAVFDVSSPVEYSYNPAAIDFALDAFEEDQYAEVDYGILDFAQGPKVINWWQLAAFKIDKNSCLRLAHYSISSDQKPIAILDPGLKVEFRGETYEICYSDKVAEGLYLGAALIPYETIRTDLSADDMNIVKGKAKSDCHFRLGGLYQPNSKTSLGIVYTQDEISATTKFMFEPSVLRGDYQEKLWTTGVSYQPAEGTLLFFAWQKGEIKGPNLSEDIDLKAYGINQFITPQLAIKIVVNDKVLSYDVTYFDKGWNVGLSYSNNTYRRTEEYLGRADTMYFWVGKSF